MFRKLLLVLLVVVGLAVIAFAVLLVITPAAPVPEQPPPKRSEEHTSELQSLTNLVCRLLLEKKKEKPGANDATTRQLACTLAAARVAEKWAAFAQIGYGGTDFDGAERNELGLRAAS